MQNQLRTLRQSLELIQAHLPGADAKFTMRSAMLLVFILERDEPASYPTITQYTGIGQTKAVDMTIKLISYGVITKTNDKDGFVAYAPTEAGLALRDALIKRLGGSRDENP